MSSVEPLLVILLAAVVLLVLMAVMLSAALKGHGPLHGRFLEVERKPRRPSSDDEGERAAPADQLPIQPTIRLLAREHRPGARANALARGGRRNTDDDLDEVLRGSYATDTYNRAVRILAWSVILITLLIVSVSQLWLSVEPQVFTTLILAGIFVLVVHEVIPPGRLRTARTFVEGTAAVVFLTMLVLLTGKVSSPFFFVYPLMVGGAALVASPAMTLLLTLETTAAYAIAALTGPLDAATARDTLTRVAINLTALVLLAYSSMVVSRVQRQTRDAAVRLSTVDSLTDLYNRAFFFNAVDREIQRGRRFRRGFCLLMMDLDGLKSINDRFGHYQGDVILRGVAQLIRAGLRSIDTAARYGGDEFVALLPETDSSGAYVVAEKIRQLVSELLVEVGGQQITTSLSIGVVSYPDDGRTSDELMIAADEAMYSSKRLGKNRVVGYAEPGDITESQPAYRRPPLLTPGFRPIPRDADDQIDRDSR